jgi:hypothetical protein
MKSSILFRSWGFFAKSFDHWFFMDNFIDTAIRRDLISSEMSKCFCDRCIIQYLWLAFFSTAGGVLHNRYCWCHGVILHLSFLIWRNFIVMSIVKLREELFETDLFLFQKILYSSSWMLIVVPLFFFFWCCRLRYSCLGGVLKRILERLCCWKIQFAFLRPS